LESRALVDNFDKIIKQSDNGQDIKVREIKVVDETELQEYEGMGW
ncbi:16062_t:CDS:2, partial [Racocetra fulgida]